MNPPEVWKATVHVAGTAVETGVQAELDGFDGLTDIMSKDPRSVPCAAEKLFTYGLGREVDPSQPYLDQIVQKWRAGDLGLKNLIKQFVINDTFRFRRGSPPTM